MMVEIGGIEDTVAKWLGANPGWMCKCEAATARSRQKEIEQN